ncbi:MAG: hypothetical protein QM537_03005 [Candidatus Symbiobacter sp.]|nr:hypothetical protein [Candidatus Symbiobacter sp.]
MYVEPKKVFYYVVARDFGFAPNPFHGYCTLATCKPRIRSVAEVGDMVIGLSSIAKNTSTHNIRKIVYIMIVDHKMTFDEYWLNPKYFNKRPDFSRSTKYAFGDNIYHREGGMWIQEKSHHSKNKDQCPRNTEKDTNSNNVLVSENFIYWGKDAVDMPDCFQRIIYEVNRLSIGHRKVTRKGSFDFITEIMSWFVNQNERGLIGLPKDMRFNKF